MVKRMPWLAAIVFGGALLARAQTPAEQKHPYEIGPEAGGWCICVTCYMENIELPANRDFRQGELEALLRKSPARGLAIDFVSLLRAEYKLPAYMFNRGDEERRKEEARIEEERRQREKLYNDLGANGQLPPKVYRKRLMHVQDQYMVLIGGYPDQESARRSLEQVRKLPAPKDKRLMNRVAAGFGAKAEVESGGRAQPGAQEMFVNPFATAMVVPNPTGPKIKPPTSDPVEIAKGLQALNADNEYSPLKHGGKLTLAVKIYRIPAQVSGLENRGGVRPASGANMDKIYEATAKQAEQLAAFLRHPQLNFESYVLHTHAASIVSVGIFNDENDPRLNTVRQTLATLRLTTNGGVEMEQLMSPPLPIPIPKAR